MNPARSNNPRKGSPVSSRFVALALGGASLLFLALTIGYSVTGEVGGSGRPRSDTRYVMETFRTGGPLKTTGEINWQVSEGAWVSDGNAAAVTEAPARLTGSSFGEGRRSVSITWRGSATGTNVEIPWTDAESWKFRIEDDSFTLSHEDGPESQVVATGPVPADWRDDPTLDFVVVGKTFSVVDGRTAIATATSAATPTRSDFVLSADRTDVALDRVEVEVLR